MVVSYSEEFIFGGNGRNVKWLNGQRTHCQDEVAPNSNRKMLRFSICPIWMLLLARSRVSKKINLLPMCGFVHSNQMLICSGFYSNSSQSYNHKESLGNESLGVCFAFCIRKGKIHNFNFVLSIPTSKHPLAPPALHIEEVKLGRGQLLLPTWNVNRHHYVRVTFEECTWTIWRAQPTKRTADREPPHP